MINVYSYSFIFVEEQMNEEQLNAQLSGIVAMIVKAALVNKATPREIQFILGAKEPITKVAVVDNGKVKTYIYNPDRYTWVVEKQKKEGE